MNTEFYASATPSLSLFIDGVRSNISHCEQLPPSQDIDDISTDFTVGGWGDTFMPSELFWGYIGKVRFWRVARSGADIRDWMYTTLNPDSPALVVEYGFTNVFASSGGDNALPVLNRNVEIVTAIREVTVGKVPFLSRRLLMSKAATHDELGRLPMSLPDPVVLRREAQLLALAEDESTTIWVDFMFDIVCIILEFVGFDTSLPRNLRSVCYAIWIAVDSVRSHVVNTTIIPESVMKEIMNQDEKEWLALDLHKLDWTWPSNSRGSDVVTAADTAKVFADLMWGIKESGQLPKLIQSLGCVSWFSIAKFQAKLVPIVGQIYLGVRILLALKHLFVAITKLRERLKENKKRNTKPGLCVSWAGGACSAGSRIPLRAGGSPQKLKVELRPPSQDGPVIVTVTASCDGVEVIGGNIKFLEGDGSPRVVTVKVS